MSLNPQRFHAQCCNVVYGVFLRDGPPGVDQPCDLNEGAAYCPWCGQKRVESCTGTLAFPTLDEQAEMEKTPEPFDSELYEMDWC